MNKTKKKKLALGAETLRQLRVETTPHVVGGFISWIPCTGSCLVACPK